MKSVLKRIVGTIPVLIGVVLLIFIMLRIIPGNAAAVLLGEHVDQATIDRLTQSMGLNDPVIVQFFKYIGNALQGDLGESYRYSRPVTEMILEAFPYTVELALLAALFAWVLGLAAGVVAAIRQNRLLDRLFMGASLMGVLDADFHDLAAAAVLPGLPAGMVPADDGTGQPGLDGAARHRAGLEQRRQRGPHDPVQPDRSHAGRLHRHRPGQGAGAAGGSFWATR